MTNENILLLSKKGEFRNKIEAGIVLAATQISGENPATQSLTDAQANKRHSLATKVLNDSQEYAKRFSLACAAQQGLNDSYDIDLNYIGTNEDSDINFTINSVWDDMSGVSYLDLNPIV